MKTELNSATNELKDMSKLRSDLQAANVNLASVESELERLKEEKRFVVCARLEGGTSIGL